MLPSALDSDHLTTPMAESLADPMEAMRNTLGGAFAVLETALEGNGVTPAKSIEDASDSCAHTPEKSVEAALVPADRTLHAKAVCARPGEWLESRKRQQLLPVIAARFRTPLGDSPQDSQSCRVFWQHAREIGVGLTVKEIPRRLRMILTGNVITAYERRFCRWLQGSIAFDDDAKMTGVMVDVLNELIVAAHAEPQRAKDAPQEASKTLAQQRSKAKMDLVRASAEAKAKPKGVKRQGSTGANVSVTKKARPHQRNTFLEATAEDPKLHAQNTAELTAKLVQEIAVGLSKWHLVLRKRSEDGLATAAVNLSSHYARVLAMFRPGDIAVELQGNAGMLATVVLAIHKLVQLAAITGAKAYPSSQTPYHYFLRLSGDGLVQVEHLCHTTVSTSVDLLALVWPQGFANFQRIEDMPKPPWPSVAGGLHKALWKDGHLCKSGEELTRRLLQVIDQGKASLLHCCACSSVDAVNQALKLGDVDQRQLTSREGVSLNHDQALKLGEVDQRQLTSGEGVSLDGDQAQPCEMEAADVDAQEQLEASLCHTDIPPNTVAPKCDEFMDLSRKHAEDTDMCPKTRKSKRSDLAEQGEFLQATAGAARPSDGYSNNEEQSIQASAPKNDHSDDEDQSVQASAPHCDHSDDEEQSVQASSPKDAQRADHDQSLQASAPKNDHSDDEDMPLCQTLSQHSKEQDPSDDENQSLASLV